MASLSRRMALASVAAIAPAAATAAIPPHPLAALMGPAGADAELVALCERHIANLRAVNEGEPEDTLDGPLWRAYEATRDAVEEAKPLTLAGMIAKARAAKYEAWDAGRGAEMPEACPASTWAWDLVNDLFRLTGEEPPPVERRREECPPAPEPRPFVPSPDVALAADCARYKVLEARIDDPSDPHRLRDAEDHPDFAEYEALMLRLEAAVPDTLTGMVALAKVALADQGYALNDRWNATTGSRIGHRIMCALAQGAA